MKGPKVVPTPFMVSIHERTEHSLKETQLSKFQKILRDKYLPTPPLLLARGRTAEFMAASPTAVRPLPHIRVPSKFDVKVRTPHGKRCDEKHVPRLDQRQKSKGNVGHSWRGQLLQFFGILVWV